MIYNIYFIINLHYIYKLPYQLLQMKDHFINNNNLVWYKNYIFNKK